MNGNDLILIEDEERRKYFAACEAEGWKRYDCFRCSQTFYIDHEETAGSDAAKDPELEPLGGCADWTDHHEAICQECLDEFEDKLAED